MSAEKPRATRDTALEDALRRIRILERIIPSTLKYAISGINGFYEIPPGADTFFGLDDGDILTNDSATFTIDEHVSLGIFGLGIHTPGTYAAFWTANFQDVLGHRVASPENYVLNAEDSASQRIGLLPFLGSIYARGYTDVDGVGAWDVAWLDVFVIDSSGTDPAGPLIVKTLNQPTAETLHVYTELLCVKLSGDTFGLSI